MLTINGSTACHTSGCLDLCNNPHAKKCTCHYPDDEIYPETTRGGRKYLVYWLIGAALTISVHLIAMHHFGVEHIGMILEPDFNKVPLSSGTVENVIFGFDVFVASLPVVFVMAVSFFASLEGWDNELVLKDIRGERRRRAKFRLTIWLCAAYGLGFGLGQFLLTSWALDCSAAIPAILAGLYGIAIGFHHTGRWANWSAVNRSRLLYPLH